MQRRTFIGAVPYAAAAAAATSWNRTAGAQGVIPGEAALPGFQAENSARFERPDVHTGDRPFGASFASRSAAYGCSGAAGTAHPLATLAAIETLKRGGSAADAAIAANACLGFLEPVSAGLGGDCFAFVWDPALNRLVSLAGSGRSPKALTLETVRARVKNHAIPALGAVSVSTPGALDAWWALHQRYGKLKWAQLFESAIEMCTDGVPVPQIIAAYIGRNLQIFQKAGSAIEETANAMHTYAPSGQAPNEGDVFRNPDLARTYRLIAQGGRQTFYEGPIARTIDAYFKRIGGWLSYEDLRAQHAEWLEPLVTQYRGVDVYAMAANTQGLATLQMLNILENFDLRAMGFQSPASLHTQAEAKRLAYEDRARYYADPHFARIPIDWLKSKEYAAQRAKLIRPDSILVPIHPGEAPSHADTTYFTVADASGLLRLESGIPRATRDALVRLGWQIGESDGGFGRYQCIENRRNGPSRVYAAASEMRADGTALAY